MPPEEKLLISVAEAAARLDLTPQDAWRVRRLVALGVLRATAMGDDGPLRFLASDLADYVKAGAPSFAAPTLGDDGLLDEPIQGFCGHFRGLIEQKLFDAAMQTQALGDDAIKKIAAALPTRQPHEEPPGPHRVDVTLVVDAAMRAVLDEPAPTGVGARYAGPVPPSLKLGLLWEIGSLRLEAGGVMRNPLAAGKADFGLNYAERFYRTRADYLANVVKAWAEFQRRKMVFPSAHDVENPDGQKRQVRITYLLKYSDVTPDSRRDEVAKWAF
jgi:hypothetical protein